ncbi:hypothetical protein R3P38DRAFT_2794662 [Favolaschia claudopus]|uniref:Uncharacterized protein n=1 Tax=Favolaschia claudopus TaxID=2862362 RepID=A0AAW0A975_9AGAR
MAAAALLCEDEVGGGGREASAASTFNGTEVTQGRDDDDHSSVIGRQVAQVIDLVPLANPGKTGFSFRRLEAAMKYLPAEERGELRRGDARGLSLQSELTPSVELEDQNLPSVVADGNRWQFFERRTGAYGEPREMETAASHGTPSNGVEIEEGDGVGEARPDERNGERAVAGRRSGAEMRHAAANEDDAGKERDQRIEGRVVDERERGNEEYGEEIGGVQAIGESLRTFRSLIAERPPIPSQRQQLIEEQTGAASSLQQIQTIEWSSDGWRMPGIPKNASMLREKVTEGGDGLDVDDARRRGNEGRYVGYSSNDVAGDCKNAAVSSVKYGKRDLDV